MPVSQTTLNPKSLRQGILHQVADYRALEGISPQFQAILTTLEIRATLAAPLVTAGELIGLVGLARKEPGLFAPEEIEILQEVANSLAIAMQHARLFEAEREQRLQAETLREVTLALTAQIELEAVLDEILLQVKRVVPYRTANIALLQKGTLHVVREQGYARWGNNNSITGMVQPLAEAPLDRRTVETGQPVVVHDSRQEPEWVWYPQTPWIRSHLMVPIHWHNRVTGILRLDGAEPGEFNLEDARRLMPLAAAAGIALENARLYQLVQHHAEELEQRVVERTEELREQYQKQAVLEERQRLARDLHDAVSQTLFSASLLAEAIPRLWERQPEQAKTSLGELHRLNRGALAEMRALLLELRPTALTEANLKDLLQQLANGLASNSKLTIALSLADEPNVPVGIKIVFYRIAQESLNNITKHARASQVLVALKSQPGQVKLTIEDDGRGFDSKELSAGHFGLNIMRERAKSIGAKFQLSSQPGEGTKVNITWPDEA